MACGQNEKKKVCLSISSVSISSKAEVQLGHHSCVEFPQMYFCKTKVTATVCLGKFTFR